MKHFFSILLWCLATLSACQAQKDHLVLRGTIPGARDSMFIRLYTKQEYREEVDRPTFCFLMLDNSEWWNRHGNKDESKLHYYETNFFVENGDLTFRTSHIDSLPLAFGEYNVLKEANYVVMGSVAQDAYAEYMKATLPLQARYRSAAWAYSDSKDIRDYQKSKEAEEQLHQAIFDFIGKRHHLDVNWRMNCYLMLLPTILLILIVWRNYLPIVRILVPVCAIFVKRYGQGGHSFRVHR